MQEFRERIEGIVRSRELPWTVEGDRIVVSLKATDRQQTVRFRCAGENVVFTSMVLSGTRVRRKMSRWRELALLAWGRNTQMELVTFSFDDHDALVGRILHPQAWLDPDEIELYVTALARECDRFEYLLTGEDAS